MEKDVTQDGEERGGNMGRIQHGGSPDPPTAAWGVKKNRILLFLCEFAITATIAILQLPADR